MTDERQIEHLGVRPTWDCMACGQPWPCEDAKERLLNEFHGQRSGLAIYMSAQLNDAFEDLTSNTPYPPPDLYARFMSWIHRDDTDLPGAGTHTDVEVSEAGTHTDADTPEAGTHTHTDTPQAGTDRASLAAVTKTDQTDALSNTDTPTQPSAGSDESSAEFGEPPHGGDRHNGPDAAGGPKNLRKSLGL